MVEVEQRAGGTSGMNAGNRVPRIDVHHHFMPPRYIEYGRDLLLSHAPGLAHVLQWTPAQTFETMEQNGIDKAILSLSQPGLRPADVEATRAMIRHCNEYGAGMVRDHRGRFGLFAALQPTDVDGSLREIEYAFDVLKADGVGLLTSYDNRWPGHPDFDPVFEELNRRKTVAFFHPNVPAACVDLIPDLRGPVLEYLFNTARTIASMLVSGTLSRLPDLTCIFCHAGGALTPQVQRLVRTVDGNPALKERVPNGAMAEIRKLYYDTAQSANSENLGALMSVVPATQILFGTDYPYLAPEITTKPLDRLGLPDDQLTAIARDNALRLFPTLRT
jgi:predicted TIM-barrel fold metal-dependent hydrolase